MPKNTKKNQLTLTKAQDIKIDKISRFFKKSILRSILKILLMEHAGYRTFKSVKNINRLFANLDMSKYKGNQELEAYIWCICYVSKQWLDGIANPDIIYEMVRRTSEYNELIDQIMVSCMDNTEIITAPEAKAIFDLISDTLNGGALLAIRDEYIDLLEDINMDEPGATREVIKRLFLISQSLLDIKHNTNMVSNKVEFNSADMDSVKTAVGMTMEALASSGAVFKTGIRRINTLLSPGYMNGRLYVWLGLPGSFKSGLLLKHALDFRKYNPGYQSRTPGMKPCVLYVSMENTFTETLERIWTMSFDEPMTNYSEEEALDKLCDVLGITKVLKDDVVVKDIDTGESLAAQLLDRDAKSNEPTIEIVLQYYPYRSISTDDLFTIIQDLRDENMEVCGLVFDYIKRIEPANPTPDNQILELDHITNELKALAVIQDIPVITAHQMNRNAASAVDNAVLHGKTDVVKLAGREFIGDSFSVLQNADFTAVLNREYKPGTDELFLTVNVIKRRRIDQAEAEFAKYTYLAHPFSKKNSMKLLDDVNLDKVLSLQSLGTDIVGDTNKEKINAAQRLQQITQKEFDEDY